MKSKWLRELLLVIVLALVAGLVACGGEEAAVDESIGEDIAVVDDDVVEEPVTLDFVTWSYGVETIADNIANLQEIYPNINIEHQDFSWLEFHDTMVARFAAGNYPPLIYSSDHWLQEWAAAGWIVPLNEHFPQIQEYNEELAPYALEGMTYEGDTYGISYYADTIDFVYNATLLQEAGFDSAPESWQDVWDMAVALKEQGITQYPMILAFSQQEGASIEAFISMAFSRSIEAPVMCNADNEIVWEAAPGDPVYDAIAWLRDAYEAGLLAPASLQTAEIDQVKSMQAGAYAFTIVPQYNMAELNSPNSGDYAGDFRIALMPGESHATVGYVRFYAITPNVVEMGDDALDAAWKFLEYFGGKTDGEYKVVERWAVENGLGFAQLPLFEDDDVREAFGQWGDVDIIREQAELARAKECLTPWFGTWDIFMRAEIHRAILGQQTVEQTMENLRAEWNRLKDAAS
jgi:multiple sugar transport system substrate-binding protein